MNILIVDDEAISVNGIANALQWDELEITNVYKAYSMQQAQEIFHSHTVHILLCDIEMPRGSGIDLIEWIRLKQYNPVCIFLTSYSHFDYASSAIRLQVFDYVLKPCEYSDLTDIISKAASKVKDVQSKLHKEQLAEYWNEDYGNLVISFWGELLHGGIISDKSAIGYMLEQRHLDTSIMEYNYYLLLLQTVPDKEIAAWDESLWRFAVRNIMSELLKSNIIIMQEKTFLAVIPQNMFPQLEAFSAVCSHLVTSLCGILPAEFFSYYSSPCPIEQAAYIFQGLKQDSSEIYALQSAAFKHGEQYMARRLPEYSDERWQNALISYNTELIYDDIEAFLSPEDSVHFINHDSLTIMFHKLLKAIYTVLDSYNLPTHQPFLNRESAARGNVFTSISDFRIWVHDAVEKTVDLISSKEPLSVVIDKLTRYIRENLNNDLNRQELTNVVHLHPDYLSTLFRQKMGVSLSEFILKERVRAAAKLLLTTDLPIHEVAIRNGFQTISYFSRQFKRFEGITPYQYRKQQKES